MILGVRLDRVRGGRQKYRRTVGDAAACTTSTVSQRPMELQQVIFKNHNRNFRDSNLYFRQPYHNDNINRCKNTLFFDRIIYLSNNL